MRNPTWVNTEIRDRGTLKWEVEWTLDGGWEKWALKSGQGNTEMSRRKELEIEIGGQVETE